MPEIRVLNLLNGQDIIGEVIIDHEDDILWYHVNKPAMVTVQPLQNGGVNLGLMPWPPFADPEAVKLTGVSINGALVVCEYKPAAKLLEGYHQTMSQLILPSTPKLIVE